MDDGQRIDWRAIPDRYRAWWALPPWRKGLWIATRVAGIALLYVLVAGGVLWYNEPSVIEAVVAGDRSPLAVLALLGTRPELLGLCLLLVPAVAAAVLLPQKPAWR